MRFVVSARRFTLDEGNQPADLALHFRTSKDALKFLVARDPLAQMVGGPGAQNITLTGNALLLLWFQGRIQQALPLTRLRQHKVRLPGSVTQPILKFR